MAAASASVLDKILDDRFVLKQTALFSVLGPNTNGRSEKTEAKAPKDLVRSSKPAAQTEEEATDETRSRLTKLLKVIEAAESRLKVLEDIAAGKSVPAHLLPPVERVRHHCRRLGLVSARFHTVPYGYYNWTLQQRSVELQCSVPQLTKSIIVENTAWSPTADVKGGGTDFDNSRYYCIIVQYAAKLNTEKLMRFIRNRKPEQERLPRKRFNFQHAPQEVSDSLTGFYHNAVSPFGTKEAVPIILSSSILDVSPRFIWMGGGEVDVKLGLSVSEIIERVKPLVGDVTDAREDI